MARLHLALWSAALALALGASATHAASSAQPDPAQALVAECKPKWDDSSGVQDLAANKVSSGLSILKDQSDRDDFCATFALVDVYATGEMNVKADKALASYWLDKLAANGDPRAEAFAFICYFDGVFTPKTGKCLGDRKKLIYWALKAARRDDATAQYFVGLAYRQGLVLDKNEADADYWIARAVAQGLTGARAQLGAASTGSADPEGLSGAAATILAEGVADEAEPDDANVSVAASNAEAKADYRRDLAAFKASYARKKEVGERVCWEEHAAGITAFKDGQVQAIRGGEVEVRYQLPGRPSTTITTIDASGFQTDHEVGGSPPTDHVVLMNSSQLGDCDLVTDTMASQAQEDTLDTVQQLMKGLAGG